MGVCGRETFPGRSFFTMRVPAGVAAIFCPLVVFLCVVSRSCYGTRVDLSPHTKPEPSLYPNPRLKSLPEPTPLPSSSPEKHMSPLNPSQISSSNKTLWNQFQLKPRPDTVSYLTENLPATSNSNSRLKLQHVPKQSSRQGLTNKSNSNQVVRNTLNNSKQSSKIEPITNAKPQFESLPQLKPKAFSNSKVVTGPERNSESIPNIKLSTLPSPKQMSDSAGTMNPSTYYNASPASLSNHKSHSKFQPSPINTYAKSDSKISNSNSRASVRAQKNETETDKDSHHQLKRGWIWNQFFVLEEHIGPEPQYVGKVRYLYCISSNAVKCT